MMTEKSRPERIRSEQDGREHPTQPALPAIRSRFDARAMLDRLSIPVWMGDEAGRLVYINPAVTNLFPLPIDQRLIGQSLGQTLEAVKDQFIHPDATVARLSALAEHGETVVREELTLTNGRVFELEYEPILSAADGDNQRRAGSMWIFYDVTARKHSELDAHHATERYRAIIEAIEDGYYEFDGNGVFTFANDGLARLLDLPREAIIGKSYMQVTIDEDVERIRELFAEVWFTGVPLKAVEIGILRPTGERRTMELSAALIRDKRGKSVGFRGIVRDISDRKASDEALQQRFNLLSIMSQVNADLNQTLDRDTMLSVAISAGVVLADADAGCIVLIEGDQMRMARMLGYDNSLLHPGALMSVTQGITGRSVRLRAPQLVIDLSSDPDNLVLAPGMQAAISIPLISNDAVFGALVLETSDRSTFTPEVVEMLQVLTARITAAWENVHLYEIARQQLEELKALNAQLTALEQLKTDMIHIASHNMRSPLGIMAGYLGLLRDDLDGVLTDEQKSYFEAIDRSLQRITRMTSDILSMEAVQQRIQKPPRERIDLRTMVQQTVADIEQEAQRKRQALVVSLPAASVYVLADPANLPEAMINLLTNAIKYTPNGGRIDVRLRIQADRVLFEVEDTGYGIPKTMQERLFQPFYRAKSEATAHIEGTGLGLFLVKKIIEQHGGAMIFRSEVNVGSLFGFDLPRVDAP